jgi:hypothetical protein
MRNNNLVILLFVLMYSQLYNFVYDRTESHRDSRDAAVPIQVEISLPGRRQKKGTAPPPPVSRGRQQKTALQCAELCASGRQRRPTLRCAHSPPGVARGRARAARVRSAVARPSCSSLRARQTPPSRRTASAGCIARAPAPATQMSPPGANRSATPTRPQGPPFPP